MHPPNILNNVHVLQILNKFVFNIFNILFKQHILHDWPDDDCIKILQRCREAISPVEVGGKVIIIELTIDLETHDRYAIETTLYYDVKMMTGFVAKERSKQEWHNVFQASGFVNYKVHTVGMYSIYELFP